MEFRKFKINKTDCNMGFNLGYKKGQFFSYDAIIAGALFSVLIALLFIYWSAIHALIFNQLDDMYRVGISISDTLLTPGSPSNWGSWVANPPQPPTQIAAHQVGLTNDFGSMRLNGTKVDNLNTLVNSSYEIVKEKLGSGRYNFWITITGYNNANGGGIGSQPLNPTGKITITRPVIYQNNPANLTIVVWMNYTI
jgi:hypothetical protein